MSIDKYEFNLEEAITQSREQFIPFLADSLLYDPESSKKMYVVAPPSINEEDGTVTVLCATEPNPEKYIVHTFLSTYVDKDDIQFGPPPSDESERSEGGIISDPNSGKLVGLDGLPLN